ncbi:Zinc finger CCHC domain-containing protein 3, partial [Nibea albiflora]
QWNAAGAGYDLTLNSEAQYERIQKAFEEKAEVEPFSRFRVVPLCRRNLKIVTVQVYNPYVGDELVAGFLRRYGQVDTQTRCLRDSHGIKTGRRQFRVLLAEDPDSIDGLRHPPAYFSIGADRGFLFYSGQPVFCRQCRSFGHLETGCVQVRCRNCGANGHGAASCTAPRNCHGCGSVGHLLRDCPSRGRTYAAVARGLETGKHGPLEDVVQEVREAKGGLGMGAAVRVAEAAVGDDESGRGAEDVADSPDPGGAHEDVGAMVNLGDCLPLVGSWADCTLSSEEAEEA